MDDNDARLKVLNDIVDEVPRFITLLCDRKEDINEVKRTQWENKISKIRSDIERQLMLLFIGPYSSGKSTFVNALLGAKGMLPTSDKPCTAVVTELNFTKGGGHRGKTVGLDDIVTDCDYAELIEMIDGPQGMKNVAHLHHIELFFDIEELGKEGEASSLAALQSLNVKIVDCPGYGSPYITNEDIIEGYIQNASFTFWMSPADRLGGVAAYKKLSHIRQKTTAIFPVITMADKVNDVQKEQATEDYYEHLAPLFPRSNKVPRFVSAFKWEEAMEIEKRIDAAELNPKSAMTKEEKENATKKKDKLVAESGVPQILSDMVNAGMKDPVTDAKIASALYNLSDLLKDIYSRAEKIESYCKKELQLKGWGDNDPFKRLNDLKRKVDGWIKNEANSVADNIETAMIEKLSDYIMQARGKVDADKARTIVIDVWEKELNKQKDKWAEHLHDEYKAYRDYEVNLSSSKDFKPPNLGNITAGFGHIIKGVLESLKYGGLQSTAMGGLGGALILTAPAVGVAKAFGVISLAALGTAMSVAGVAIIVVAAVPLLPIMFDKIKEKKEQYRKEMEAKLRAWMKKLDLAPAIQGLLNGENEKLYDSYKSQFSDDISSVERDYLKCQEIKEDISRFREKITLIDLEKKK